MAQVGWATLDPTTRDAMVREFAERYPWYEVRDFDPYSVLEPIIMDTRTGQYVDMAGNVLRADGSSPMTQGTSGIGPITINKVPFPVWLLLGAAVVFIISKGKKL